MKEANALVDGSKKREEGTMLNCSVIKLADFRKSSIFALAFKVRGHYGAPPCRDPKGFLYFLWVDINYTVSVIKPDLLYLSIYIQTGAYSSDNLTVRCTGCRMTTSHPNLAFASGSNNDLSEVFYATFFTHCQNLTNYRRFFATELLTIFAIPTSEGWTNTHPASKSLTPLWLCSNRAGTSRRTAFRSSSPLPRK